MKKLIKYILLVFLLLFGGVVLAEILLGIIYEYRNRDIEPMAVRDYPYLYFLYKQSPGRNIHGFKTDHPQKKAAGKYRIILTGGSVAMGQLPAESIAHYLEAELNKRFNTDRIEVINAGVSAFVAEQVFLNIQLILQHYEPDMIVSLDGYNDLMTFKFNRQYTSGFELPPHYWRDFRVIQYNHDMKTLNTYLKNISKAIGYFERKHFEKNHDWNRLNNDSLKPFSLRYWQIMDDTYDFCKAKHIYYCSFLQPIKYYNNTIIQDNAELKALTMLYRQMENGTNERKYAYSLTSIFKHRPDIFTDDCHITPEGNEMIANAIAERVADEVEVCLEN